MGVSPWGVVRSEVSLVHLRINIWIGILDILENVDLNSLGDVRRL